MATWTLQRRDGVNHGQVACPSGHVFDIDLDACVTVETQEDRDALLAVGQPTRVQREAGITYEGFWTVVKVDGVPLMPLQAFDDEVEEELFPPVVAEQVAVVAEETSVIVEDAEEGTAPLLQPASNWRRAKANMEKATEQPKCKAVTKQGAACKRNALPGKDFCMVHDGKG